MIISHFRDIELLIMELIVFLKEKNLQMFSDYIVEIKLMD